MSGKQWYPIRQEGVIRGLRKFDEGGHVAEQGDAEYNEQCDLTEAQKNFLTVLARIAVRRFVKEVEKQLEGEML